MKDKLKMFAIGLGVVTFIVAIVGLFLIVGRMNDSRQATSDTDSSRNEVERFYGKNPFPSPENTEIEIENARRIEALYRDLNELLRKHEIQPLELTPGQFKDFLAKVNRGLNHYAREREIKVNEQFPYGFGEYTGTEIPRPRDVPRLTQQLQIMSNVCITLFDAGITELESVEREKFEVSDTTTAKVSAMAGGGALVNPNAGVLQGNQLFVPWRFRISFNAKEAAIRDALNRLNRDASFLKVNSISLRSPSMGVDPPKNPYEGSEQNAAGRRSKRVLLPPNDRMVSGTVEPILPVRMELSVYRFAETQSP